MNTADGNTADSIYLTVSELSAESGDDGQVGRGNRVNGLITLYRSMSLEAAAGKLYNVMTNRITRAIVTEVPDAEEAYCYFLSRIGHRISEPPIFDVKVRLRDPKQLNTLAMRITEVARGVCQDRFYLARSRRWHIAVVVRERAATLREVAVR